MEKHLYHPVRIGSLIIPGNLFLAPLAGFTDPAFRQLCLEYGASLTYSEMVSAEALARNSEKTIHLMKRSPGETLLGIQIFLSDSSTARRALPVLLKAHPSLIDINCGCPVPKVVKTGSGSALMRNPEKIGDIVRVLTENTDIPVTVKIRSGWDSSSINYLETAEYAVKAGASLITMHPRTRTQGYSGFADWSMLNKLKKSIDVPVVGSGNLFTPEDAQRMLKETGIDGVMFARGAIGNPFIFEKTKELLTTGSCAGTVSANKRFSAALTHLKKCIDDKGESVACREMRKHIGSYTKGIRGGAALRNFIVHASTYAEYEEIFSRFLAAKPFSDKSHT